MFRPDEMGYLGFGLHNKKLTFAEIESILFALSDEEKANVRSLALDNMHLGAIPESVQLLTNLEFLDLEGNQIKCFPEWIGNLTSLVLLSANSNNLQTLPVSIGNLSNLLELSISGNLLTTLPSSMRKLTKLASLMSDENGRLPEHLQLYIGGWHSTTQSALHDIALEARQVSAREATAVWMLGAPQIPVHRDVRNLLSQMIYATRGDEVWENATTNTE